MVAMYPSPAGATESELELSAWQDLRRRSTRCSRVSSPMPRRWSSTGSPIRREFAIAPIDECYALVGAIKLSWEGISGGAAIERAVPSFFDRLRKRAGRRQ